MNCDGCIFKDSLIAYNFDFCRRCLNGGLSDLKLVLDKSVEEVEDENDN